MTHGPSLTLKGSVYGFALACLLGAAVISGGFLHLKGELFTDTTLDYAVRFRTSAAAQDLARTLERDWRDLGFLSEQVGVVGSGELRLDRAMVMLVAAGLLTATIDSISRLVRRQIGAGGSRALPREVRLRSGGASATTAW